MFSHDAAHIIMAASPDQLQVHAIEQELCFSYKDSICYEDSTCICIIPQ